MSVPPPVLSTAEVNGDELVLFYGEGLDATSVPAAAAFTVTAGGAAVSVSTVSVSGLRVTLGLASVVTVGQAVLLDYAVPSSNPLQGGSGIAAGALVGQVVENRTPTSVGRSLVSNTGQDRFGLTNFRDNRNFAQGFRTGMTPDGYVLSSLELVLRTSGAAMSDLTVTLRNASGNDPDTVLATFVNPDSPALITTGRTFRFTLSEGEELDPETRYFIHLNNSADSSLGVATTESDNQDSGSLSDWGIDDMARIEGSGVWSDLTGGAAIQIWLDGFAQTPAPVLSTAEVNGDELVLSYGEALDAMSVPAAAAFTVTAGGAAVSVSSVSVSGQAVTLGLASVVRAGQTVLLDYVVPSEDPLQDRSGSDAGALAGQAVENRTPAAPPPGRSLVSNTGQNQQQGGLRIRNTMPIAQGFRTGMTPEGYVLSSLELLLTHGGSGPMSNLTVTLRNASGNDPGSRVLATFVNPDSPALRTTRQTFRFTFSEGVELDPDTRYFIHMNYNHPSASIFSYRTLSDSQDSGGLEGWGIDDVGKQLNNSSWQDLTFTYAISIRLDGYAKTPAPVLSTAEVDGDELVLTYGEALDESSVPAAAAFTVTAGGAAVSVSTVSVSKMVVTLGLASAVTAGQTVLLDYVVPSSNPLQNGSGTAAGALAGQAVLNQTLAADLLWTSAVTIGNLSAAGVNGYTDATLMILMNTLTVGGSLTDDDFEHSGSTYTVKSLFVTTGGVRFEVDQAGLPDTLTLELANAAGTWTIAFSDKTLASSTSTRWIFARSDFTSAIGDLNGFFGLGKVATVCLRQTAATNACPAARYGDPPSAPLAPSAPTVSAVSEQSDRLSVSWTAPSNGGSAIRDYDVRYCRGAATVCTADADFTGHVFTGTATATTIAMLMGSSEYQVQVRATNAEGAGPWSASGAGTTATAPAMPPAGRSLVSNTGQTQNFRGFREHARAQRFGTGMTPDGYVLSSLELIMRSLNSATMSNLTVTLRNDFSGSPSPGARGILATFVNPDPPALSTTGQTFRFTLPEGEELDPDRQYFIHLNNNHPSDEIEVAMTVSDDQDSGGLDDWGIDDSGRRTSPSGWRDITGSFAIQILLDGYAKTPAPVLSTAEVDGDELVLTYGEVLDESSVPAAAAFIVTAGGAAVSVSSVSVSRLAVTLGLASVVTAGQTVLLDYVVPSSNPLQNGSGSEAGALAGQTVSNQTLAADLAWTSAVTIGGLDGAGGEVNGYTDATLTIGSTTLAVGGSLTDDDFVYSGNTYTVKALFATTRDIGFMVDQAGLPDTLTLELAHAQGTWTIAFSDKASSSTSTRWIFGVAAIGGSSNQQAAFEVGQVATVCLRSTTATNACPAARYGDPPSVPLAPSAPTVSAVSGQSDRLSVSWTAPMDGGSAIRDYDVRYCQGAATACTTDADFTGHAFTGTTTATMIAMLMAETEHQVQVRATNAVGAGPWSASGAGTTVEAMMAPPGGRILVSNTGLGGSLINLGSVDHAQGFRTGMTPDGYVLSSLDLIMSSAGSARMSNLTVTLRNASGTDPGSRILATFINPDSPALRPARQTFRFTLSEGEELDPDTRYFIHWSNNHPSDGIHVAISASNNQDSSSLDDWGIDDNLRRFLHSRWQDYRSPGGNAFSILIRLDGDAKRPPVLSTAGVNGDELVLTYGEALDESSVPVAAAFTVTAGGAAVSVSTVSVSGMAVTLGLASAVTAGQTVLLDYVVPSSNPLQNGSGSDAGALAGQAVENRTLAADLVWTSTVVIENIGGGNLVGGYNTDATLVSNSTTIAVGGSLTDDDFDYSGSTYTVKALFATTAEIVFVVEQAGLPDTLTLELGNAGGTWTIAFSDKTPATSTSTLWSFSETTVGSTDPYGSFDGGKVATACLRTATQTCPAARYSDPPSAPLAPLAPTVSAVSEQSDRLSVSWTAPSDGGSAITDYDVRYCRGAAAACMTDADFAGHVFTGTATAATIAMLMAATEHQVQVRATNAGGAGPWSASGAGTTAAVEQAELEWTSAVTIEDLGEANGYNSDATLAIGSTTLAVGGSLTDGDFEYSGSTYTIKALIATSVAVEFVVDQAGLPDTLTLELAHARGTWRIAFSGKVSRSTSTRWVFEVESLEGFYPRPVFEMGKVTTVCLRTATQTCPAARYGDPPTAPLAPLAPTVSAVSGQSDRLTVSWMAPSDEGSAITDYDVQYCQGAATACTTDANFTEHAFTGTTTAATIAMLVAATEHQVQVRATNAEGTGPWSASGAGTTAAAPAPTDPEWTSAVTIGDLGVPGGGGGYNTDATLVSNSATLAVGGSLTDDDFDYSGSTYTVKALFATSVAVEFEVDPAGLPDTLTLEVANAEGTWTIAFSDKTPTLSTSTRWHFFCQCFHDHFHWHCRRSRGSFRYGQSGDGVLAHGDADLPGGELHRRASGAFGAFGADGVGGERAERPAGGELDGTVGRGLRDHGLRRAVLPGGGGVHGERRLHRAHLHRDGDGDDDRDADGGDGAPGAGAGDQRRGRRAVVGVGFGFDGDANADGEIRRRRHHRCASRGG